MQVGKSNVLLNVHDFGILSICALRYAMGRQSYMPDLVRRIVSPFISKIDDTSLGVMIEDCGFQRRTDTYGDPAIDKPDWIEWERKLLAEQQSRQGGLRPQ